MKTLKENVKEKILNNATDEFYQYGFANASMRRVAKKSKMVVGNIYRYYNGKEVLFNAVVEPAYKAIIQLIGMEAELNGKAGTFDSMEPFLTAFIEICETFPKQIVSLVDRYIGVDDYALFESLKKMIIDRLIKDIPNMTTVQSEIIFNLMLRGVLFILQNYPTSEISLHLRFLFVVLLENINIKVKE